jgi:hypothetical protein
MTPGHHREPMRAETFAPIPSFMPPTFTTADNALRFSLLDADTTGDALRFAVGAGAGASVGDDSFRIGNALLPLCSPSR